MIAYHVLIPTSPLWPQATTQIGAIDWPAGPHLAKRMQMLAVWQPFERVIYATVDDQLAGFCALLAEDIVPDTPLLTFCQLGLRCPGLPASRNQSPAGPAGGNRSGDGRHRWPLHRDPSRGVVRAPGLYFGRSARGSVWAAESRII